MRTADKKHILHPRQPPGLYPLAMSHIRPFSACLICNSRVSSNHQTTHWLNISHSSINWASSRALNVPGIQTRLSLSLICHLRQEVQRGLVPLSLPPLLINLRHVNAARLAQSVRSVVLLLLRPPPLLLLCYPTQLRLRNLTVYLASIMSGVRIPF